MNTLCSDKEINVYITPPLCTPLAPVQLWPGEPVIWCKLDFMNPSGSTKERIAAFILGKALREGALERGGEVIEASSGSTSIAMAMASAQFGLRFTAVMPEGVSNERSPTVRSFGGSVVFSPKDEGMGGAVQWQAHHR